MPGNQVIGKDVVLVGQDVIAAFLGVSNQCITGWYERNLPGLPKPIEVHHCKHVSRLWREAQKPAWEKWHAAHMARNGGRVTSDHAKGGRNRHKSRATEHGGFG
jgi:hypothetical protein